MFTTLQCKPLQDLRRYVSLPDMHPVDPETETDISSQAMVTGQLYGRWDKSEMFPLPRPLWSPLSKAGAGAGRSVVSPQEADPKDSIFHSTETSSDSTRAPIPINHVSGTGIPRSILSHPGFRSIREKATISPGSVAEAVSSAYQYQTRPVSADSLPLKQTTSIRSALGSGPELSSRGKAQYGSAPDHFMPPKVPLGSSLTPSKGQQVALTQQYMPARQYHSRAWNSSAPTEQRDGIDLDPLYHTTISKYFECLQISPSKLKKNFTIGNRSSTTSWLGFSPSLANKPWVFTIFGRASAFHNFFPQKGETLAPVGGPAIEAFIHPRHRTYFHQFLRDSVVKRVEGSAETKEAACEIVKDGVTLEGDNDNEHKIVDLEQNDELDIPNRPISAHCPEGSVVSTLMAEESDTAELIQVLTPTFHENDDRVIELEPDTEKCSVAKTAPSSQRRTNTLRYLVRRRTSLFKSISAKNDFTFVVEVTAGLPAKRKHDPKEDNTENASRKRTRDNSVESSIASPRNSIASRLSILIGNAEKRQAKLNSPGRELVLSPINTQCVQVTEHLITEPLLSNSIPDSPVTPTSFIESTARSSTHSVSSTGTSLTVPYSQASASASRKLLTTTAWEEEEQLRGRQSRRAQNESRYLCVPGSSSRRSHSIGATDSECPSEYSIERTRRRSLSTNSMLTKCSPMFQRPTVISTLESQSLEIEETPSSSGSSSFVEPTEPEGPFISSAPAQLHATLSVPAVKPEDAKDSAQKRGFRRISYLGQSISHKSFTARVPEPSATAVVSKTEDAANKKKFQKLKNRVKGITKKVSHVIKKEKY
ncbi:hypothetical protein C7212DRAFT_286925 [Tuber magnatum]|uniref:Uncharacterized protein n=1 Tax=Tuber magnatum TaxID=42249 RepID=A0A317SCU3_9PEZI|nr:hypothetical protein C7212DRAFT_286925 [Tuber magnatum]